MKELFEKKTSSSKNEPISSQKKQKSPVDPVQPNLSEQVSSCFEAAKQEFTPSVKSPWGG